MSKPAQKPRPAPANRITRAASSRSASSIAWLISSRICGEMALIRSGRLSVILAIRSVTSYVIVSGMAWLLPFKASQLLARAALNSLRSAAVAASSSS